MKHDRTRTIMVRLFLGVVVSLVVSLTSYASPVSERVGSTAAHRSDPVELEGDAVQIPDALFQSVHTFITASQAVLPGSAYRLTAARVEGDWAFVSVTGFDKQQDGQDLPSYVDRSSGLLLARKESETNWLVTLEDTAAFRELVTQAPETFIEPAARPLLMRDSSAPAPQATVELKFPWLAGKRGWWGEAARANSTPPWVPGAWHGGLWGQGLDFWPEDWRILSMGGGVIERIAVCQVSFAVLIRHVGDVPIGYLHLDKNSLDSSVIQLGRYVEQGRLLGVLKPGTWNDSSCGYTDQNANAAHLHWDFPTDREVNIEGWRARFPKVYFEKNGEQWGVNKAFISTNQMVTAKVSLPAFSVAANSNFVSIGEARNDTSLWSRAWTGTQWTTWDGLEGKSIGAPVVLVFTDHRELFVRGLDGQIWRRVRLNGVWHPWESLGGQIEVSPVVITRGANRIEIFARGTDGSTLYRTWDGTQWLPWENLQGHTINQPAAVSWGPDHLEVFVRGMDAQIWRRVWNGAWLPWESLGEQTAGDPVVITRGVNRLDIFTRSADADKHILHRAWDGTQWLPWESLRGQTDDPPTAVSWGSDHLVVFVRGMDGQLWYRWWDGTWSAWTSLGGAIVGSPHAVSWGKNRMGVFVRTTDGHIQQRIWDGTQWLAWEIAGNVSLPPAPSSTPTPQPTTATPQPTTTTPQPTTTTPQPTTTTPQPTTATPQPTTATPQPTTVTPQPTTVTPQPIPTGPTLSIENGTGTRFGPGSFLVVRGQGFVPGVPAEIFVNGIIIGRVVPGADGSFTVAIFFSPRMQPGSYTIAVSQGASGLASTAQFNLTIAADAPVLVLPAGALPTLQAMPSVYLPVVFR